MPSGPRIRTDNVFGTLTDNPLTNVATTMNSAGLANLAAVSSAHALVVIDPLRSAGAPECVIVTAHTGSATSATITRGAYGTSARQHASGVLWVHAPNVEDFIRIVTAATRPSDPYEGQMIFETDTNKLVGYGGTDWAPRDAGGQLGYAQTTADQTSISALVDLTNLSATVTVGTGRRVKITGQARINNDGTAGTVLGYIRESSTVLNLFAVNSVIASGFTLAHGSHVLTPSAGSHTYKLSMEKAGAGTFTVDADATYPPFILVEDIGAA